jgi:hypothetical protein
MMYFLDFDRTTFDTDSFIVYLQKHPIAGKFTELNELGLAQRLNEAVLSSELTFAPGELSQFLYGDAARFLRDKENAVMLITFGNPALQKAKVESALYGIPRITTIYTGDVRKGDFIAPHIGMYGQSPVFVDDSATELEILSMRCPGARVLEMRRDGATPDGRWEALSDLSSLV